MVVKKRVQRCTVAYATRREMFSGREGGCETVERNRRRQRCAGNKRKTVASNDVMRIQTQATSTEISSDLLSLLASVPSIPIELLRLTRSPVRPAAS